MVDRSKLAAAFAEHLGILLEFHMDDDAVGQGQFTDQVEACEPVTTDNQSLHVTLASGQRLRITVEVA